MNEREVLARVRAVFDQQPTSAALIVGNGDDGAVYSSGDQLNVVATDMAVEGIHFRFDWSSPQEVGRKITAANLADICAMGGWPEYLLVSVAFPDSFLPHLELLAEGIYNEARKTGAAVIGGDLSKGEKLVISITAIGRTNKPIRRSGASVGEYVMISHLPGWSAAGLALLMQGKSELAVNEKRAIAQHKSPEIDYQRYRESFPYLSSATDISDGLFIDAGHLAQASSCAIAIDSSTFEKSESFKDLKEVAEANGVAISTWILGGGEDHVLLATSATPENCPEFIVIGRVESGEGLTLDGKIWKYEESGIAGGYQHSW